MNFVYDIRPANKDNYMLLFMVAFAAGIITQWMIIP